MTSALFDTAKKAMMFGEGHGASMTLDLNTTDVIKCRLVNVATDYPTLNLAQTAVTGITKYGASTDFTLTGAAVVAAGTTTFGTVAFDSPDAVFTAVAVDTAKTVSGLLIYKFVTDDAGSMPILWIDGFTPVTPNGGDITVQFDGGANRIFSLT